MKNPIGQSLRLCHEPRRWQVQKITLTPRFDGLWATPDSDLPSPVGSSYISTCPVQRITSELILEWIDEKNGWKEETNWWSGASYTENTELQLRIFLGLGRVDYYKLPSSIYRELNKGKVEEWFKVIFFKIYTVNLGCCFSLKRSLMLLLFFSLIVTICCVHSVPDTLHKFSGLTFTVTS